MRHFVFLRRDAFGALFQDADESRMCHNRLCLEEIPHRHSYGVGDMSAAELLSLSDEDFAEAFQDLRAFDPGTYCDIATARLELMCERDEDEEKATDDRGRKVA